MPTQKQVSHIFSHMCNMRWGGQKRKKGDVK
jgi:hypothetical protein